MKKSKMVACALAFSLCSFISYAGVASEESNAWGSEEISFNEINSLPATEMPNRGLFGCCKKTPAGPRYVNRRNATFTIKLKDELTPQKKGLHPDSEKHLYEDNRIRTERNELTQIHFKKTNEYVQLPIKTGSKHADLNNFVFLKVKNIQENPQGMAQIQKRGETSSFLGNKDFNNQ